MLMYSFLQVFITHQQNEPSPLGGKSRLSVALLLRFVRTFSPHFPLFGSGIKGCLSVEGISVA